MSTWFHNYKTKDITCKDCGKVEKVHEESESVLCFSCASERCHKILFTKG